MRIKGTVFRLMMIERQFVCQAILGELRIYATTPQASLFLTDDMRRDGRSLVGQVFPLSIDRKVDHAPIRVRHHKYFTNREDEADAWVDCRGVIYTHDESVATMLLWKLHDSFT